MQIVTGIKIDTKIRVFGVICSHMTAYNHLQHLQRWCPCRFGIKATLPPAFRNRSSSPSAAPAAAEARIAISPPSEHQPHWEGAIPQLARASKCTWDWDGAAYHVFPICGVCPASVSLCISASSGNALLFSQASDCSC